MVVGLVEDGMTVFDIGGMDGIVDPDHHHQQPRQRHQQTVGPQGIGSVRLLPGEWIILTSDAG